MGRRRRAGGGAPGVAATTAEAARPLPASATASRHTRAHRIWVSGGPPVGRWDASYRPAPPGPSSLVRGDKVSISAPSSAGEPGPHDSITGSLNMTVSLNAPQKRCGEERASLYEWRATDASSMFSVLTVLDVLPVTNRRGAVMNFETVDDDWYS